eukprot:COSAG04_NODE_1101_length_8253_cov_2.646309_1_plen_110_part_10
MRPRLGAALCLGLLQLGGGTAKQAAQQQQQAAKPGADAGSVAASLTALIQPLGPQYTVNVKPATTQHVASVVGKEGVVSTLDATGRAYACELPSAKPKGGAAAGAAGAGT